MKALIIDDHSIMRRMIRSMLDKNWEVIEAGDGEAGLAALKACSDFDWVFTDYNMPIMNGLQMLEAIRRDIPDFNTRIVFISSERDKDVIESAKKLGVTFWLPKPFKKEDMNHLIKSAG